jgi:beta-galactosidase GanA
MKIRKVVYVPFMLLVLSAWSMAALGQMAPPIPQLVHTGKRFQLLVDGKPFLMLSGQADNSSASNPDDLKPAWEAMNTLHGNTLEIPLYWELLEPQEGKFDFHLVDQIIAGARSHGLRVVFLWFGTWKNGTLDYAPEWIKKDPKKYFHAEKARLTISPFCEAALAADERAFAALMKHILSVDQEHRTVIMMQVENETGLIDTDRDYAPEANAKFAGPAPKELMDYLEAHRGRLAPALEEAWSEQHNRRAGTWTEVFGDLAPEAFSAWAVARYVDGVAAAGKKEYPLPMYVNCALMNPGDVGPGDYNSGGPGIHVLDVWKAAAPHIDVLSPDIYFADFLKTAAAYTRADNPLFVPETGMFPYYDAYVFATLAQFNGFGYAPYGVDISLAEERFHTTLDSLSDYYGVLEPLIPMIAKYQYTGQLFAIVQDDHPAPFGGDRWRAQTIPLGNHLAAAVRFSHPYGAELGSRRAGGLIIELAPDDFIVTGAGFHVDFQELQGPVHPAQFLSVEEGTFQGEDWMPIRRLNGEEMHIYLRDKARTLRVRLLRP